MIILLKPGWELEGHSPWTLKDFLNLWSSLPIPSRYYWRIAASISAETSRPGKSKNLIVVGWLRIICQGLVESMDLARRYESNSQDDKQYLHLLQFNFNIENHPKPGRPLNIPPRLVAACPIEPPAIFARLPATPANPPPVRPWETWLNRLVAILKISCIFIPGLKPPSICWNLSIPSCWPNNPNILLLFD